MKSPHIPESLLQNELQPLWASARQRLDRFGPERRGTVARPDLGQTGDLTLRSLMGRKLASHLDLAELETALTARDIGEDLCSALTLLGHPPSREASRRRAVRQRAAAARAAVDSAVTVWPEPWAAQWAAGLAGSGLLAGLEGEEAESLVEDVRRLLDRLDQSEPDISSRTELAATLFGSAHALDPGTRRAAFATRALQLRIGDDLTGRELWEASGIQADRVSAPALVWRVPATGDSALAGLLRGAARGGLPLHVSLLALRRDPVVVPAGTQVLAVENPRLVEAAAEQSLECCVVSTNGNPTTAVTTLVQQMRESGACLWYHGDFDASGIAICRRMHDLGCRPWMMDAQDYRDAIVRAECASVRLDRDARGCGPTPWDPALEEAFDTRRLIVHEEFVLDEVLGEFRHMALRD